MDTGVVIMTEKTFVTTGNIFADLGLENPEELLMRSDLLMEVMDFCKKSDFNKKHLSAILKITLKKAEYLLKGQLAEFNSDELRGYLSRLNMGKNWSEDG